MLWDIIRDFFIMYIFGGTASDGTAYACLLGAEANYGFVNTFGWTVPLGVDELEGSAVGITFGDWLSSTFTIITLILICYMFLRLTIWLFKFGAGLFKW